MSAESSPLDLPLKRLIQLAGDAHDLLAVGNWEAALPLQEEFDEAFAMLQHLIDSDGIALQPRHADSIARLMYLNTENERLARDMHTMSGIELRRLSEVGKLRGYAPLGASHQPVPRYLDNSA
jgi:hypothetical protein